MEQSKGKVNLTEKNWELQKNLTIGVKGWPMAICRKKNLKIINLRAKNPHLLRFKIQTLWNHFWKVLSEFWQTWGNTWQYLQKILAQSFLAQKCRTAAGGEFLRVFNFIFDFFILNLVSGHLGIHLGIGQSAAFGKKMNVSLQNVKFWANVTNLTKDEISDGELGNLSRLAQLTAILSD